MSTGTARASPMRPRASAASTARSRSLPSSARIKAGTDRRIADLAQGDDGIGLVVAGPLGLPFEDRHQGRHGPAVAELAQGPGGPPLRPAGAAAEPLDQRLGGPRVADPAQGLGRSGRIVAADPWRAPPGGRQPPSSWAWPAGPGPLTCGPRRTVLPQRGNQGLRGPVVAETAERPGRGAGHVVVLILIRQGRRQGLDRPRTLAPAAAERGGGHSREPPRPCRAGAR